MMRVYVHSLGIINALGSGSAVRNGLSAGSLSGIVARDDLLPGRNIHVAEVRECLPAICLNTRVTPVARIACYRQPWIRLKPKSKIL